MARWKPKKKHNFSGYAQRWTYGMKAQVPGELIQIDHATIKLGDGMEIKHFKAVCPITKFAAEQVYKSATSFVSEEFLGAYCKCFSF
jgi:hypothetical protein